MKTCRLTFMRVGYLLLVMIVCVLLATPAAAQDANFVVSGKVTDSQGAPLPGVTVKLKGSTIGTSTNAEGAYSLRLPSKGGALQFSFLGFLDQEAAVTSNTINVSLREGNQALEEVVVVGYGTQQKASITGAVSSIRSEDLVRTPASAATSALVGKVPGVTFRATDARPGNGTTLQIRNLGAPLFVIDGVPYSADNTTDAFGMNTGVSGQNLLNNLGLEDIESISVLKDASASVYGLRASNGVVLITTKKGRRNETPAINVSSYYGLQNFTRFPRPANAGLFVRGLVESNQNQNQAPSYSAEELAKWEAGTDRGYKSYDYFDEVTRPNVPQYYLSANATGGSERSNYYFSVSHLNQDAIIRDFNFNRTNLQANLSSRLAKGLQIGTQISGRIEKRHNVGVPGLDDYWNPLLSISSMWPTESPYANDNPRYIHQTHNVNVNPATYKDDVTGYVDQITRGVNVNLNAQYDFNFGLTVKGIYSYYYTNDDFDGFEYTYDAYRYNEVTDTYYTEPGWGNQNPWRERHKRNVHSRFGQLQVNYSKQFGQHSLSAVAAYERSDNENSYLALHSVPSNNYTPLMNFSEQDYLDDSWRTEARAGYVGRVNYNYQQKYLVEVLGRYDGSYLYGKGNRWGFFPGVSAGWRISEEPFFKNRFGEVINDFKLRASYGETGSELGLGESANNPPTMFTYLGGYNFREGSAVLDGAYIIGLRPRNLPITRLSWVTNRTKNIGFDFTVINKLTGQFDFFERKRTGLPVPRYDVLLPSEVGYTLPVENLESDATRGMDGFITFRDQVGQVSYSIGVNGTIGRRKVLDTYKPRRGNSWDYYRNNRDDRWADVNWGFQVVGQFQSQEEIDNYPINNDGQGNRSHLPGDLKYKDVNADGIINDMDMRPIGYAEGALPYLSYGINGSVAWKNFTLAFDFAGAGMQSFFRDWELKYPFQNNGNSPTYMLEDHWRRTDPYDPNSEWIPGTYPALRKGADSHDNYNPVFMGARSDYWLTNVRYLRLKNLEIGYNIPQKLLRRAGIARLRVYANGTNLFSFDNVKEFEIDPEISSANGIVYPQQKLYNFGFNLTL